MTPRFDLCKLTFEHGTELGDEGHSARSEVLADGDLLEEDRDAAEDHRDEVDEEEGSWNNERYYFFSECSRAFKLDHSQTDSLFRAENVRRTVKLVKNPPAF